MPAPDLPPQALAYIRGQERRPVADPEIPDPRPQLLAVLAGIIRHQLRHPGQPAPSATELPAGWTGYPYDDASALQQLHVARITLLSPHSPPEAFDTDDDGLVLVEPRHARYTLLGGLDHAAHVLETMTRTLCDATPRAAAQRERLKQLLADMEVHALLACAAHVRARPLDDDELAPYAAVLRQALASGHTVQQVTHLVHTSAEERTGEGADVELARYLENFAVAGVPVPSCRMPEAAATPAALTACQDVVHAVRTGTSPVRLPTKQA